MSSLPKPDLDSWIGHVKRPKRGVPEGLWIRCEGCKATVFRKQVEQGLGVCPDPECGYHFYVPAHTRIAQLLDEDSFEEWFTDLKPCDPLEFHDKKPYSQRLKDEQKKTTARVGVGERNFLRAEGELHGITCAGLDLEAGGRKIVTTLNELLRETERHLRRVRKRPRQGCEQVPGAAGAASGEGLAAAWLQPVTKAAASGM